jgi:hypothetical protein
MTPAIIPFLQAVSATAALVVGLVFFRFWHDSRDRLFAFFGTAFWLLALSWALLALFSPTEEARPYIYAIRLLAFTVIIIGIVDKNRAQK